MNIWDVDIKARIFLWLNNGKHGQGTHRKWVLIVRPKISQMIRNSFVQFVCPSPKVWNFNEKKGFIGHLWSKAIKGGFYLERADAFVVSPNRQT